VTDFPPALPHGELQEVLSGVFYVKGQIKATFGETQWQFSRAMTVLRDGDSLTLLNSLRLDDEGLAQLDALGKVEHVVKLGAYHGRDDAFYVDRYGASMWAMPAMEHSHGLQTHKVLAAGEAGPCAGSSVFIFETSSSPEAVLHVERDGGVLVTCDSFQNMLGPDEYFDEKTGQMMDGGGFFGSGNIGPGWLRAAEPQKTDFDRLLGLGFRHLLSGHGEPLLNEAHSTVQGSVAKAMG
jgi:hypothetical protein